MSLFALTTTTADIERATTTVGSAGGQSKTWAAVYTSVPFVKQPASGRVVEEFGKLAMRVTHVFYTETPVALRAGDRINEGGVYYLVRSFGDMAGRGVAYKVVTERIDQ